MEATATTKSKAKQLKEQQIDGRNRQRQIESDESMVETMDRVKKKKKKKMVSNFHL